MGRRTRYLNRLGRTAALVVGRGLELLLKEASTAIRLFRHLGQLPWGTLEAQLSLGTKKNESHISHIEKPSFRPVYLSRGSKGSDYRLYPALTLFVPQRSLCPLRISNDTGFSWQVICNSNDTEASCATAQKAFVPVILFIDRSQM